MSDARRNTRRRLDYAEVPPTATDSSPLDRRRRQRQDQPADQTNVVLAKYIRYFLGILSRTTYNGNIILPTTGETITFRNRNFLRIFEEIMNTFMNIMDPVQVMEEEYFATLLGMTEDEVHVGLRQPGWESRIGFSPYLRSQRLPIRNFPTLRQMRHYDLIVQYCNFAMRLLTDQRNSPFTIDNIRARFIEAQDESMSSASSSHASLSLSANSQPRIHPHSSSLSNESTINLQQLCQTKFAQFNLGSSVTYPEPLKRFTNKLKRVCNTFMDTRNCNVAELLEVMKNARRRYQPDQYNVTLLRKRHNHELEDLYRDFQQEPSMFRVPLSKWKVKYDNEPGVDAGGIRTHFIQAAAEQIIKSNIFVETEPGTGRYTFNSDNELFAGYAKFLGVFLAFCFTNSFTIDFHLSRCILLHLIYKNTDITLDDYATIYMLEYPEESRSMLNLLRRPEDIVHAGLDFEDIGHPAREVSITNFREYMGLRGKYKLMKGHQLLHEFQKGFYVTHRFLQAHKMSPYRIDAILTSTEVPRELRIRIMENVLRNIRTDFLKWRNQSTPENNQKLRTLNFFMQILKDGDKMFPTAEVANSPHLPQDYKQFIQQLLFFWTGKKSYDPMKKYTVALHAGDHFAAHTCFDQLDIPNKPEHTQNSMYRQLIRSIASPEFGFD
jgi:hypothetical protein